MLNYLHKLVYGPQRPFPPAIPTDEIVPVHVFDDTKTMRQAIMPWSFLFHDILDPDMLADSLSRLFEMEGWRKFGGRFRLRPDGKLEIHIPRPFTNERPSLHFTKLHIDAPMRHHPVASKFPRPTNSLATFPCDREFTSLTLGPGAPWTFEDYIYSDTPQFSLRVVTFTDATLVCVSFSHITTDFGGFLSIVKAWSRVLAGAPQHVPRLVGFREDGMSDLWKPSTTGEKHVMADKQLTGWRIAYWGLWFMFESWWTGAGFRYRTLCIPRTVMDTLMLHARGQTSSHKGLGEFITEGDVLVALACRMVAQGLPPGSTRPLTSLISVDPRKRVKSALLEDAAYVQNSPVAAFFDCTAAEAVEMPLGQLAQRCRHTIDTQCTEEQLKAMARIAYKARKTSGMEPVFGHKDMMFLAVTNWSKGAMLKSMDFSPAIVKPAAAAEEAPEPGHPGWYNTASVHRGSINLPLFSVAGRDHLGNLWMSADLPKTTWSTMLNYLSTFNSS